MGWTEFESSHGQRKQAKCNADKYTWRMMFKDCLDLVWLPRPWKQLEKDYKKWGLLRFRHSDLAVDLIEWLFGAFWLVLDKKNILSSRSLVDFFYFRIL